MAKFKNNTADRQFEYHINGNFARADYHIKEDTLYIDYVEAPPSLRGTGAAGKLMENIYSHAEREGLEIVPICGYAAHWFEKNK